MLLRVVIPAEAGIHSGGDSGCTSLPTVQHRSRNGDHSCSCLPTPEGAYHFLSGIDPYSCGVVADPGHEVVHATLQHAAALARRLRADRRPPGRGGPRLARRSAGSSFRSPEPFTMAGFIEFNRGYIDLLRSWGLYMGDLNPIARTNVAPRGLPSRRPVSLQAFLLCGPRRGPTRRRPSSWPAPGSCGRRPWTRTPSSASGELGPDAMREKARHVVGIMEERLVGLGAGWDRVTTVDVYTVHLLEGLLEDAVLPTVGPEASRHGLRWINSRPPVREIEFEMDLRGTRTELTL